MEHAIIKQWENGIISAVQCVLKLDALPGGFPVTFNRTDILENATGETSTWPDQSGRSHAELLRDARRLDQFASE